MVKALWVSLMLLLIAGIFTFAEAGLLLRDLRRDVNASLTSVKKTLQDGSAAAEQLRQASAQANLAAQEERNYFQKTSLEAYKTAAAARLVLVRTDHSLNDVLAPALATNLQDSDMLMRQTASDMQGIATGAQSAIAELQPTLANLARASDAAAISMADPHIADTLANVDATSKGLALTSLNVADTTGRVDAMAGMLQKRLAQLLKPATLAERFAERILGLGATTYGVVK